MVADFKDFIKNLLIEDMMRRQNPPIMANPQQASLSYEEMMKTQQMAMQNALRTTSPDQILREFMNELVKLADSLGFCYINPSFTDQTQKQIVMGKDLDTIRQRYIDMLKYFNITKDMMRI